MEQKNVSKITYQKTALSKTKHILILFCILVVNLSKAQLLGNFNACPGGGCTSNGQRIFRLTAQPSYCTMDSLLFTGLNASGSNAYSFVAWQTGGSLNSGEYLQFVVRPNFSNWGLVLDSLKFDIGRNASGPRNGVVGHNKSGSFLSNATDSLGIPTIAVYSGTTTITFAQSVTWNLSGLTLPKGDTLVFRFYGRGSTSGLGGTLAFNNISLYGRAYDVQYRSNAASGNWATAADWEFNSVPAYATATLAPTAEANVTIRPNHTITRSSNLTVGSDCNLLTDSGTLVVNGGITINSGDSIINRGNLQLTGDFANNGTYIGNSDTVVLNGGSNQTLSGTTTFNRLTHNGSTATIAAGGGNSINITGVYTHQAGTLTTNGNLFLKATGATTYGQIAGTGTGTISGNITAEYQINSGGAGWRPICSPLNGATLAQLADDLNLDFGAISSNAANVYYFDESAAPYWNIASGTGASMDNRAYSIYMGGSATWANPVPLNLDITGTYNGTSDYVISNLGRNGSIADTMGWHVVRNPWPCGFTWNGTAGNITVGAGGVQGQQVWVYDQTSGSYTAFDNASPGVIPPFTPFTFQVTANNTGLTFLNAGRTTGTLANYFDKNGLENTVEVTVVDGDGKFDKAKFYTDNVANDGYDIFDGNKKMNTTGPNLYFVIQNNKANKTVWNKVPKTSNLVDISFEAANSGLYTMQFGIENLQPGLTVFLFDKKNNSKHAMAKGNYSFAYTAGEAKDRFGLWFEKTNTTITELAENKLPTISCYQNTLVISNLSAHPTQVEIFDLLGRSIAPKTEITPTGSLYTQKLENLLPGYYIVKITGTTAESVISKIIVGQ